MASGCRDIVVAGGSAEALHPLFALVEKLPERFAAAVFVVIHRSTDAPFVLPDLVAARSRLRVAIPEDEEPIELGKIYVAPPDFHLMVKADVVRLARGPKENGFRPAVDPQFRTAAASYGNRVIGVVLSGELDDGTHGLLKIKQAGGVAVVQDPEEAESPSMPRSAIRRVAVNHVVPAGEMAELVTALVNQAVELTLPHPQSQVDVSEGVIGALRLEGIRKAPTPLICPECGGLLWEIDDEMVPRYRCHVGHGFTAETLTTMQASEAEKLMWSAIRLMEEHADTQRRIARRWEGPGNAAM